MIGLKGLKVLICLFIFQMPENNAPNGGPGAGEGPGAAARAPARKDPDFMSLSKTDLAGQRTRQLAVKMDKQKGQ